MTNRASPHHHHRVGPRPDLARTETALLLIDLQYHGANRGYGLLRERIDIGEEGAIAYFADRVESTVVPAVQRLEAAFRSASMEVIHVKTQSLTRDGRDRSPSAKLHGTHIPPGSREGDILDAIAPAGDEIVLSKTCSSAFNGTNIEYILRNLGVSTLVVGGVVTGSCVELAVRDASDLGFRVIVAEDATASWSAEMQVGSIEAMRDRSASIMSSAEIVEQLSELVAGVA